METTTNYTFTVAVAPGSEESTTVVVDIQQETGTAPGGVTEAQIVADIYQTLSSYGLDIRASRSFTGSDPYSPEA